MSTLVTFENWFKEKYPEVSLHAIRAVLALSADGATIPFIARYRKEQTGNLSDIFIEKIVDEKELFDEIQKRQAYILSEIEAQGKLDPALKEKILSTFEKNILEDLYLPYRQKKRTKASKARDAGIEPLADWIWNVGHGTEKPKDGQTLEIWAFTFRNEAKGYNTAEEVIAGAQDILVERLSENQDLRQKVRDQYKSHAFLISVKTSKAKSDSKFENYFNFREKLSVLAKPENSHRYLAMRRGFVEGELKLSFGGAADNDSFESEMMSWFDQVALTEPSSVGATILKKAAETALKVHVTTSIENEMNSDLKAIADLEAIEVFATNVKRVLLASPYGPKSVMGIDPGIRTGCKVAIVDDTGKFIISTVIHFQTDEQKKNATEMLMRAIMEAKISAIAIGNGTHGRETESFIRLMLKEKGLAKLPVVMVSESGASIYSASEIAREEFPNLDPTERGAISIARRLQDPLAELVKVDPKSIGVGQYQHDVSQPALKRALTRVVELCVNTVGINLNTASKHLLSYVSGIGPALAENILQYRSVHGIFKSRDELKKVSRFSDKIFEQAAGFLRVFESDNPLDKTAVHPEQYSVLQDFANKKSISISELKNHEAELKPLLGEYSFQDVITELARPGRDPRDEFVPVQFRDDIFEIKDLKLGMQCPGVVTNVTSFGAFVDIGVHQDGLVHLSQLSGEFVKDPTTVVQSGDRVNVRVIGVDLEKKQISLSMKPERAARSNAPEEHSTKRSRSPQQKENRLPRQDKRPPKEKKQVGASAPHNPNYVPPPSKKPERKPKPAFNNAFAGLAGFKISK
ncbi:MAG: RNA-binding transcriptional accessory protein [Xanthomonadaceae bacterium]|nr:RNA-binding transcriptional accessory protein [Xanthomonadaceae bacterium]